MLGMTSGGLDAELVQTMGPYHFSRQQKEDLISHFSLKSLFTYLRGHVRFTSDQRRNRTSAVEQVIREASDESLHGLAQIVSTKDAAGQKHRQEGENGGRRTRRKLEEVEGSVSVPFLQCPSKETTEKCYANFYEATGNTAIAQGICAVCARECGILEDGLSVLPLSSVPNSVRLIPKKKHAAHFLVHGRLVEPAGVSNVCGEPFSKIFACK